MFTKADTYSKTCIINITGVLSLYRWLNLSIEHHSNLWKPYAAAAAAKSLVSKVITRKPSKGAETEMVDKRADF